MIKVANPILLPQPDESSQAMIRIGLCYEDYDHAPPRHRSLIAITPVTIVFFLIQARPGEPAYYSTLGMNASPQVVAPPNKQMSLNYPVWQQHGSEYKYFKGNLVHQCTKNEYTMFLMSSYLQDLLLLYMLAAAITMTSTIIGIF